MSHKFFLVASLVFVVSYSTLLIFQPIIAFNATTLNVSVFLIGAVACLGYIIRSHVRSQRNIKRMEREKEFETVRRLAVETQMQTFILQLDPGRMYDVFSTIRHLIETKDDLPERHLENYSKYLHRVIRQKGQNYISVADELDILQAYVSLQQLILDVKFNCYILFEPEAESDRLARIIGADKVGEVLDIDEYNLYELMYCQQIEMPNYVLQLFIHNAIWHGIRGLSEEDMANRPQGVGIVIVQLYHEGETIRCVVEDNGVGREESNRRRVGRSFPISATQQRLETLKETFGVDIEVSYEDLRDDTGIPTGTRVTIVLPCSYRPDIGFAPPISQHSNASSYGNR